MARAAAVSDQRLITVTVFFSRKCFPAISKTGNRVRGIPHMARRRRGLVDSVASALRASRCILRLFDEQLAHPITRLTFRLRCAMEQLACGTAQWQSPLRLGSATDKIPHSRHMSGAGPSRQSWRSQRRMGPREIDALPGALRSLTPEIPKPIRT
jgi:hypothetical protein